MKAASALVQAVAAAVATPRVSPVCRRACSTRRSAASASPQSVSTWAHAWLKALNDVRLALGVRLNVTEEFEQQWGRLRADDPQWAAYEVYAWLGAVQESLVQALA